jgi:hypothetical protein
VDPAVFDALAPVCSGQKMADLITDRLCSVRHKGEALEKYLDEHVRPFLDLPLEIISERPRDPVTGIRKVTKVNYDYWSTVRLAGAYTIGRKIGLTSDELKKIEHKFKTVNDLSPFDLADF